MEADCKAEQKGKIFKPDSEKKDGYSDDIFRKKVKINALQLCAETELIMRYYNEPIHKISGTSDRDKKDKKMWFLDSVYALMNKISNITKN